MEPVIKLADVWKTYMMGKTEVNALKGVSLEILPGEFVAIIGKSGSGKSTLMNMVGCLDTPTKGRILLEGKDITKMHESDLAQIRGKLIGFIFQQFNLIPSLTALENVMLPMVFQGIPEKRRKERAESLLKAVEMEKRAMHKPTELSGGEQQRIAIARALANNPDIILADEPTGNLDSKTGKNIFDLLINLHEKEKKTLIIVTHDIQLAKTAERIYRLSDGIITKDHLKEL